MKLYLDEVSKYVDTSGYVYFRTEDNGELPNDLALQLLKIRQPFLSHSSLKPAQHVVFIPDSHYIKTKGFQNLILKLNKDFESKTRIVYWRGSTTGSDRSICTNLQRVKICQQSLNLPWCDIKIAGYTQACANKKSTELLQNLNVTGSKSKETKWSNFAGLLDVDGNVNAWGLFWRLASRSVVFKVESEYTNFYIEHLVPWVHYVPIKADLSDLAETTALIASNRPEDRRLLANISHNAAVLTESFTYQGQIEKVASRLEALWKGG